MGSRRIERPADPKWGPDAVEIIEEGKSTIVKPADAGVPQKRSIGGIANKGLKSFSGIKVIMFLGGNAFILNHTSVQGNTLVFQYQMEPWVKVGFCKTMNTFFDDFEGC